jgi:hypothetical protein
VSWREFIALLVGSLAWPVVAGIAVWLFRRQLQALLEGPIKRWKAGPFEFEKEWANATERVGEKVVTRDALTARDPELDELVDLAAKAPAPAILAAHNAVEETVREIASGAGIEGADGMNIAQLASELAGRGLINDRTGDALRGLAALRNLAAHGPTPDGQRAREYIVIAEAVLYSLSQSPAARGATRA